MDNKAEFSIDIMELEKPIYVVGRTIRVKHGTPECFPVIGSLISGFFADNMPSKISNKKEPTKALLGKTWSVTTSRDEILTRKLCTLCLQCMIQCPYTVDYAK